MITLFLSKWIADPWRRRGAIALVAVVLVLLAIFPRDYRAAATLTPSDPSSLGLGGALGQLGAISGVYGSQTATEVSLRVARAQTTRDIMIDRLNLMQRLKLHDRRSANRWLANHVEVRALRGGIIEAEAIMGDRDLAMAVVTAEITVIRDELSRIGRSQTARKREILVRLVEIARQRWLRAQSDYDALRRRTRYSQPGPSIEAIGERIPTLEAQLRSKEVELQTLRAFATDQNISVRQVLAQIATLRDQLRQSANLKADDPNSVDRVVVESTQVQNLEREVTISRGLYDNYRRFLEGTQVEDLTASTAVRILEKPYVDYTRPTHAVPKALLMLLLLFAMGTEIYAARPPVGAYNRRVDETA